MFGASMDNYEFQIKAPIKCSRTVTSSRVVSYLTDPIMGSPA
jgi:hypothetical protein